MSAAARGLIQTAGQTNQAAAATMSKGVGYLFDSIGGVLKSSSSSALPWWLPLLGSEWGGGNIDNTINTVKDSFKQAQHTSSPLILDLDGDGVETVGIADGLTFDHDGNGFAERSGWAGKDDGVLVWDRNGNGRIENGSELFGNNMLLANGWKAANGFLALADLDSNQDGVFDSRFLVTSSGMALKRLMTARPSMHRASLGTSLPVVKENKRSVLQPLEKT